MDIKRLFCKKNGLDELLKKSKENNQTKFLIVWNRGLGDIALGLYGLNLRIRMLVPNAKITYLTRADLAQGFSMLPQINVIVDPEMKRGESYPFLERLMALNIKASDFDWLIEKPDPTRWLKWQLGRLVPKLFYRKEWDELSKKYGLSGKKYIGVHIDSETGQFYRYQKNWPKKRWEELFWLEKGPFIIFGNQKSEKFDFPHVVDLRGETTLHEMLSVIKNHCKALVVPDSGILSITYYVRENFPLKIISLWSDPHQGVLKAKVRSPNRYLTHIPLIRKGKIEEITPQKVSHLLKSL